MSPLHDAVIHVSFFDTPSWQWLPALPIDSRRRITKELARERRYHLSDYKKKMLHDNTINRGCKIWSTHSLCTFKNKSAIIMSKYLELSYNRRAVYPFLLRDNHVSVHVYKNNIFSGALKQGCIVLILGHSFISRSLDNSVRVRTAREEAFLAILWYQWGKPLPSLSYVRGSRLAWLTAIWC